MVTIKVYSICDKVECRPGIRYLRPGLSSIFYLHTSSNRTIRKNGHKNRTDDTDKPSRNPAISVHTASHRTAWGVVHHHSWQEDVERRLLVLLGSHHPSSRRGGLEPSACRVQDGWDADGEHGLQPEHPALIYTEHVRDLRFIFRVRYMKVLASRGRYVVCQSCVPGRWGYAELFALWSCANTLSCQAMEAGLREVCRSVRIGKILIQRVRNLSLSYLLY